MGCVFGKPFAGRREARRRQERDEPGRSVATASENGIVETDRCKTIGEVAAARRSASSTVPEFRLRMGPTTSAEGWPSWLLEVAGSVIKDWKPRRANTFEKLQKIGQGTYSNVYKAKDLITGKIVALKKVRFDNLEPETVRFMAREILVLRQLNHPNVIKLEGLVISRLSSSLYLVFEYMEHDLSGLAAVYGVKFTEPQVKCFMKQLLCGLEHCHNNGVLHRDIKCSNLLIDNDGMLKIADFGLASFFDPEHKKPMTSRVVTLWYRPPELLLGATYYGAGVDLWSAGCILAELFAGKPILRGRTEVEQLHKIFKLCGSPTEEYWKKSKLPNPTLYKPQQSYKRCIMETYKDFPSSSLALIETLLSVNPDERGSATAALNSEFFRTGPDACEPWNLPKFPPSKELDIKLKDEEARRRSTSGKKSITDANRRARARDKAVRAIPAPEANAELQTNLDRLRIISDAKAKSKSEKFPPPHQDGAVGYPSSASQNGPGPAHISFAPSRRKVANEEPNGAPQRFINALYPNSVAWSMDFKFISRRRAVPS
ncbi:probable serine/threonine-protein kinase At1g54610 isoform X2 [Andrographis paniculata]|uniref:probable serine/threonine-protein kinase At1g54610 isoform X2 n=1 Tax=Andrographis paniculata TaxID=175694 RepID=UPI0021E82EE7|nr:probable serine/threonine-protein kinase At1g54610 isoform X2 [Andrographis paniculata]